MMNEIPLSLYVHVPWCVRKCPYCDFNSHAASGELPWADYVTRALANLDAQLKNAPFADCIRNRPLHSIFFGGGTPSLMPASFAGWLLDGIHSRMACSDNMEITLEANPGTAEAARFRDYRQLGINRLSVGVQSFHDHQLQRLGRIHSSQDAHKALDMARHAGFERINIDLMHGLPAQTPEDARIDLQAALDFDPGHLSWYQLTIEPNTLFWHRPPTLPADNLLAHTQTLGERLLADRGYQQYEVSAWARPGQSGQHNLNYWRFGDYLAIGPGAHGKLTDGCGQVLRFQHTRTPADWLARKDPAPGGLQRPGPSDLVLEVLMNGLRLRHGIDQRYLPSHPALPAFRQQMIQRGLLADQPGRWVCTTTGYRFLDSLLESLSGILD